MFFFFFSECQRLFSIVSHEEQVSAAAGDSPGKRRNGQCLFLPVHCMHTTTAVGSPQPLCSLFSTFFHSYLISGHQSKEDQSAWQKYTEYYHLGRKKKRSAGYVRTAFVKSRKNVKMFPRLTNTDLLVRIFMSRYVILKILIQSMILSWTRYFSVPKPQQALTAINHSKSHYVSQYVNCLSAGFERLTRCCVLRAVTRSFTSKPEAKRLRKAS